MFKHSKGARSPRQKTTATTTPPTRALTTTSKNKPLNKKSTSLPTTTTTTTTTKPTLTTIQQRHMSAKKLTVILAQDFEGLGKAGDLIDVRPGHARNHLLPKGIATYDTSDNRKALKDKGIECQALVKTKDEEVTVSATRSYPAVAGDLVRNMHWDFFREPVTSADNHIKKPVTKRDVLMRFREAKFFFIQESDIEFSPGHDTLDHCGSWPCAVALHFADESDWAHFEVQVKRQVQKDPGAKDVDINGV